jgi:undecaprenyl-diphosphatase
MDLLELFKAAVLGIIEGITEWLPVSSTGHMILADEFIKLRASEAFKEMFLVVIQLGAILAVVVLYFHKLNFFSGKKTAMEKRATFLIWVKVAVASIPAGIIGFFFDEKIDSLFFNELTVSITLILYGLLFIAIEKRNRARVPKADQVDQLTYKAALLIGVFQLLALIPGTSRSGATIIGAMLIGTSRLAAAEFSFFLAIPAMFVASAYKLFKFGFDFTAGELSVLLVGMTVAFVVSILAIRFLMGYIQKKDFKVFGYYRIALGIVVLSYFWIFR